MGDMDDDGDLDFMGKGGALDETLIYRNDFDWNTGKSDFSNPSYVVPKGSFHHTTGFNVNYRIGDYDNDGKPDILVRHHYFELFQNQSNKGTIHFERIWTNEKDPKIDYQSPFPPMKEFPKIKKEGGFYMWRAWDFYDMNGDGNVDILSNTQTHHPHRLSNVKHLVIFGQGSPIKRRIYKITSTYSKWGRQAKVIANYLVRPDNTLTGPLSVEVK